MIEKLNLIVERFDEISNKLSDMEVITDQNLFKTLMKEQKSLTPLVDKINAYQMALNSLNEAKELLITKLDKDFRDMVQEEYNNSQADIERIEQEIKILLLPKDPNDEKGVIIEIRGGAGGDEAALFAYNLYRMYTMYAETKNWKAEIININEKELGGIKEVAFMIDGNGAFSRLKFESGVHRVQRVPETESSGRIHTSTVTVAVLPEVEDVEVDINPVDLEIDTYRASGAGGQHVNKTESAIRITHVPSGIVVECQDERSQHKNRDKAMKLLRSKIYEAKQMEQTDAIAKERKTQVGTGDRSERIRTYNYPQGRVSDHRIGLTLYKLEAFMNGDLDEMIDALNTSDQSQKLNQGLEI